MTPVAYRAIARWVRHRWKLVVGFLVVSLGILALSVAAPLPPSLATAVFFASFTALTWTIGLLFVALWFGGRPRASGEGSGATALWSRIDTWGKAISATVWFLSPIAIGLVFFGHV